MISSGDEDRISFTYGFKYYIIQLLCKNEKSEEHEGNDL